MSVASVKSQVQTMSNKLYGIGGKHIAGQHSLTTGELICFAIAVVMTMFPTIWGKVPIIGKYGSVAIALAVLFIAFVIW